MNSIRFGNHIIIKAPENPTERQVTVNAFRDLARKNDIAPMGETVLLASVEDRGKDDVFIQFAKNRQLPYVDLPLTQDPIEAIKSARRHFGMD